ncbi:transposase [Streptomyces hygroscopicus]|uniref:transposase n=1 Tax=Streptomyces hygroscopicus TaxID=1912 RepID=UPI00205A6DF9|nr:hypothetical protein HOK021_49990 [Streptomyces hygroscopicus]
MLVSRDVISDEAWAVLGPLFPAVKTMGRPPVDRPTVVEATAWRFRTGAPWRDLPERFGNWNTIYKNFGRWSKAGVWARVLEQVQAMAHQGGDVRGAPALTGWGVPSCLWVRSLRTGPPRTPPCPEAPFCRM